MKTNFKNIVFTVALVLLFGQGANQLFCGDIDCLEGESSEICITLLCNILVSHTSSTHSDAHGGHEGQDEECQCLCHLQFNRTNTGLVRISVTVTCQNTFERKVYAGLFSFRIDHPPRA